MSDTTCNYGRLAWISSYMYVYKGNVFVLFFLFLCISRHRSLIRVRDFSLVTSSLMHRFCRANTSYFTRTPYHCTWRMRVIFSWGLLVLNFRCPTYMYTYTLHVCVCISELLPHHSLHLSRAEGDHLNVGSVGTLLNLFDKLSQLRVSPTAVVYLSFHRVIERYHCFTVERGVAYLSYILFLNLIFCIGSV